MTFITVGIDPTEDTEMLRAYQETNAYPWTFAQADRSVLERFNVISTSIKYAVSQEGLITYHRGYGVGDAAGWEQVLEELVAA